MDCPRCDGPLESYALRDRQAAVCSDCGWVGIDVALSDVPGSASAEPWEDALDRVSDRYATVERSHTELPPVTLAEADDEPPSGTVVRTETTGGIDVASSADGNGEDEEGGQDEDEHEDESEEGGGEGDDLDELEDIGADDVETLRDAGLHTVDDLAAADPLDLADETGIPEERTSTYVRKASIRLVTGESES